MPATFPPSRSDGRSDARVILELVRDATPQAVYTYDELETALRAGLPAETRVERDRIYQAVAAANRTLLRHHHRNLGVVRGLGYRVMLPEDHAPAAMCRYRRGENQVQAGLAILKGVDWDGLTPEARRVHEGTLLVVAGVAQALRHATRDVRRIDSLVDTLTRGQVNLEQRLARLEASTGAVSP